MALTLAQLDDAAPAALTDLLTGVYGPRCPVAAAVAARRPLTSAAAWHTALTRAVRDLDEDAQRSLVLAHAVRLVDNGIADPLFRVALEEGERAALTEGLMAYEARFGFAFVLALGGPRGTGLTGAQVLERLQRRLGQPADFEWAEAMREPDRIARLALDRLLGTQPDQGNRLWDQAEALARHSDPGFAERGQLTVTYLTAAHQACAQQLIAWMHESGFDEVGRDALGNVVGLYRGHDPQARRLLTGSHYDTVRNGGKYDGRLGVLVPMAAVRALHEAGERAPVGIEVVAFAEEEGQRFHSSFLCASALIGRFDPAWLEQRDAQGVTMREAIVAAGLDPAGIAAIARDPARYLGFVEVHIEQGPVLNELKLPLGVVTSINGGVRYLVEITGMAGHAGTTPMDSRRDAAAAAAELMVYLETRASAVPDLVGTVGLLEVPGGSINVIPGCCRFSLDIRATTDEVRDACTDDVLARLQQVCERRGLSYTVEQTMRVPAAPCAPSWQQRWREAVAAQGLPVHDLSSGAGHDAMRLHEIMPQGMLFVRGDNAGISHNPLESITAHDAQLAVDAMLSLIRQLPADGRP
ncbi:MAG: hydantoinase/carbamoylase family amidase [Burkholderiaceae bacterium]